MSDLWIIYTKDLPAYLGGYYGYRVYDGQSDRRGDWWHLRRFLGDADSPWAVREDVMNGIGWAIKEMHTGNRVTRAGWNGKGMWLALQVPDEHSKMTLPYIYMRTAQGDFVPWLASQTDLLATDWHIA